MMNAPRFGFLLMGFTFTVTQSLLIREMLVGFYGNELSIGLILGNWLIFEAIGSGILGRWADRLGKSFLSFAWLQILLSVFLPLCLFAAYACRNIVGAIPGEGVGLVPIFWSSSIILAPLALVDGTMFAFGSKAFARHHEGEANSVGRVYVFESLGAILGGIIFTYIFIAFFSSLQIVLFLCDLNLFSATLLIVFSTQENLHFRRISVLASTLMLIVFAGIAISPWATEIQRWSDQRRWSGMDLVYSKNSVYGNVSVVRQEAQYTFFADGMPILTSPAPDVIQSEEMVHLPLLFVPEPKRALVLSGGPGGVLSELMKYSVERIDYAELDPLLVDAVRAFPTALTAHELGDPRLNVELVDGRLLVRQMAWKATNSYDIIVVNLPYPSTLQLNRFFTEEFLQFVRGLLTGNGVLVLRCPGSLSYLSEELGDLNRMVYQTLREVFPYVRPVPGDITLWLASPADELTTTSMGTLLARWEARGIKTSLITAPYIQLRMGSMRLDWFWQQIGGREVGEKIFVNRDLHPSGLLYGLAYWHAVFSPKLTDFFSVAGGLDLWSFCVPILVVGLMIYVVLKRKSGAKRAAISLVIASTGFVGMAADLVVIFSFQSLYGYVYHWIGLIITAFMAGLSLGGLLMTRNLGRIGQERRAMLVLELAMVAYWILVPVTLSCLYARSASPPAFMFIQVALFGINVLGGVLVGSQFPLANNMFLEGREGRTASVGILYACDLVGAFLGAITISVLLIPVLGILETCLLAVVLKMGSLTLVATIPPRQH